jgi:hypothetical protein
VADGWLAVRSVFHAALRLVKTNPALQLYERLELCTTHEDEYKLYMRRDLRVPS